MVSRKAFDGVTAMTALSSATKNALHGYGISSPVHIIPNDLRLVGRVVTHGVTWQTNTMLQIGARRKWELQLFKIIMRWLRQMALCGIIWHALQHAMQP
jgi:hypothetical protein